jgi:hypothetical protein
MTNKEIFVLLAKAYLEDYDKDVAVYDTLYPFGITLSDEHRPLVFATETILENLTGHEYIIEFILDFHQDGYITFTLSKEDGTEEEIICHSLEELFDFITS